MFTGIIQAIGTVGALELHGRDRRLGIQVTAPEFDGLSLGESVCVGGVCLSIVALSAPLFHVDVSAETLARSTLGGLKDGARLNLERALTPSARLGGHLVSGHVDDVGRVLERVPDGRSISLRIEAPPALARYIAVKGSICVDGVSLTVNGVEGPRFEVNVVPYTLAHTTLGELAPGARVNLEVDVLARYLERLLAAGDPPSRT